MMTDIKQANFLSFQITLEFGLPLTIVTFLKELLLLQEHLDYIWLTLGNLNVMPHDLNTD